MRFSHVRDNADLELGRVIRLEGHTSSHYICEKFPIVTRLISVVGNRTFNENICLRITALSLSPPTMFLCSIAEHF